ncbi:MAG: sulfocyanin-like copper-binding protein [Chloroflexota bacterium]
MKSFRTIPIAAVGLALALAACSASPAASPTKTTVTGTLTEYAITLSATSASAGIVEFDVTNAGTIIHEFVILKTDTLAKDLPLSGDSVDEDALDAIGEVAETDPSGTGTFTATLAAGHYAIICNIPGHVMQGMVTDFTVN